MKYLKIFEAFGKDIKIDRVNRIVDVYFTTKWLDSNLELTFEDGEYNFWYHNEKVIIVAKGSDKYHSQPEEKDEWRAIVSRLIIDELELKCRLLSDMIDSYTQLKYINSLRGKTMTYIQYCLRKYLSNKLKEELGGFYFTMEILSKKMFRY